MKTRHDSLTLDLFEVPAPRNPIPGALALGNSLRHLLSDLLKSCPRSRFEVAVSTHSITAWLADLRGCKVLVGKEALDAEIGKRERLKEEAGRKIKQLKHAMGEME